MPWTAESLLTAIGAAASEQCFTEANMVAVTGLKPKQVENACQNLRRHGFIVRSGQGCYTLTPAGRKALDDGPRLRSGPKGPQASGQRRRERGLRQRLWNALRMGKKLTLDDLLMRAVDGEEKDARSNARKYITALAKAGYVVEMGAREAPLNTTSNGCKRWLLVSDTGPAAPVWRKSRDTLYDPNLEREVALAREIGEEALAA